MFFLNDIDLATFLRAHIKSHKVTIFCSKMINQVTENPDLELLLYHNIAYIIIDWLVPFGLTVF